MSQTVHRYKSAVFDEFGDVFAVALVNQPIFGAMNDERGSGDLASIRLY